MTLPKNVESAMKWLALADPKSVVPIRDHLLSRDAEIAAMAETLADYENASKHAADDCVAKDAEIENMRRANLHVVDLNNQLDDSRKKAESRLAAADALLQDVYVWNVGGVPHSIGVFKRITEYLQGDGS